MWTILETIFPVFVLMLAGMGLRKSGFMDVAMETAMNKLCYWIFLPVFLLWSTATAQTIDASALTGVGAMLTGVLFLLGAGFLTHLLFRLPRRGRGTYLHACFRSNNAYIGMPIVGYALRSLSPEAFSQAIGVAAVILTPTVLLYNLLGVLVLEWDRRHSSEFHPLRTWIRGMVRNPLVIGCVIGLGWNLLALPAPALLGRIVKPLGDAAFPLALLAIGARIASLPWQHFGRGILGVCLVKNALALPLSYAACRLFNVDEIGTLIVMVMNGCPTAVSSYALVDQLDGDRDLGAAAIAATTLLSVLTLSAALWVARFPAEAMDLIVSSR